MSNVEKYQEARDRLAAAGRAPEMPKYFWRKPEVALAVIACIARHGTERCHERFELGLDEDGQLQLWNVVVRNGPGEEVLGAFDFSYPCPPKCPPE